MRNETFITFMVLARLVGWPAGRCWPDGAADRMARLIVAAVPVRLAAHFTECAHGIWHTGR
jgi:hypothetical protein